MNKALVLFFCIGLCVSLTSCNLDTSSSFFKPRSASTTSAPTSAANANASSEAPAQEYAGSIGGSIGRTMDSMDKEKLEHALDKPIGKSTQWTNAISTKNYTVTPIKKIEVNNNRLCREYSVKEEKNGKTREFNGRACVDSQSNWQSVSG